MIVLSEQYGYNAPKLIENIDRFTSRLGGKSYKRSIQKGESKAYCFKVIYDEKDDSSYRFETSYFVGVDWIVENKLPIHVYPKLDDSTQEIDYIKMLFETLKEPDNYKHLDQLYKIDFNKPSITVNQTQDLLSPLLLIHFIHVLKKIVQKGLRKSYYTVIKNLNARVKGKILINETIKKNHFNSKAFNSYCQYDEFGVNSLENKVLKKAFLFSISAIQNIKGFDTTSLKNITNYINPAFSNVDSEVNYRKLKSIKPNPLFKEYEQALKLARIILRKYGYNITNTKAPLVKTPPFWVDMSKLFEFYVYSKLKERFTHHSEVTYHKYFNRLQPDYIIKSIDGKTKMVVDAKYKPRYNDSNISIEDIRQISGYGRLDKVYKFLEVDNDKVIDCLVIYSNQEVYRNDFIGKNFNFQKEKGYNKFYKIGIRLPLK